MHDPLEVFWELLDLAVHADGELELTDRDDLDPETMMEVRRVATSYRNAIDLIGRSLAQLWMERYGESAYVDPESGMTATASLRSGSWKIEDPDGFAEYLRTLTNEEIVKIVGRVNVGSIPRPVRNAVLSERIGAPALTISSADNPKLPKWITNGPRGEIIER